MDWTLEIDQCLKGWIKKSGAGKELKEAALYSLFSGGKRLRPRIFLNLLKDLNSPLELNAACSLELIHTYSLIHDDLPCMDDDDFRRGKPSLHRAFSESTAVLTGDFLLTLAFESLAQATLPSDVRLQLILALAKFSGASGMIGGQILDMQKDADPVLRDSLKTGALFACSFSFAGIIAGQEIEALEALGVEFGLLYQWMDDVEDGDKEFCENLQKKSEEFQEKIAPYPHLQKVITRPAYVPS